MAEPFAGPAARHGYTVPELFEAAARFQATGQMRRFAAVLYHRSAGFTFNGMGVWRAPEERTRELAVDFDRALLEALASAQAALRVAMGPQTYVDPAADPLARIDDVDVGPTLRQRARGGETGETCANHDDGDAAQWSCR